MDFDTGGAGTRTAGRPVRCFLLYALIVVGVFASVFIPLLLGR